MTMAEKIFSMHDVSRRGFVRPGDIIQVEVDWILASEITWKVKNPTVISNIREDDLVRLTLLISVARPFLATSLPSSAKLDV
jgi:homoaconitase/3-isopropylmalate dehydratase large subunit